MSTPDSIFKAIAHPARRQMLSLLSASPLSVRELTAEFSMSQPAVSQHLRELREARLVVGERAGVERRYRLTAHPLKAVYEWSAQYRRFFDPAGHAWALSPAAAAGKARKGERRHGD